MQIDLQSKSKSLLGVSDLTLVATIKSGLIPALDSRSYDTRVRTLLRTLNTLRISSLEAEPTPLIADAVDRVRALHSFRLAIVGEDPPRRLLLSVAFDGGWEPYMRRIWRDLGPLLDVIFCNCEGYLDSNSHNFPAYAGWVRSAQVETQFFYNASSLTVNDLYYLRRKVVTDQRGDHERPPHDGQKASHSILAQAIPALTALYRLTDLYPPLGDDGGFLLRAARHLLGDCAEQLIGTDPQQRSNPTERAALSWFSKSQPRPQSDPEKAKWNTENVQGGIIEQYTGATDACLLLVAFKDSKAARDMLAYLEPEIKRTTAAIHGAANEVPFVNLGFTIQGLALAGVPNGTLGLLPFEFREGMAARAGILGDRLYNHPTKWSLPERNRSKQGKPDRVELSSVHAIVQYTCKRSSNGSHEFNNDEHPLSEAIARFNKELVNKGVQILSVQSMRRFLDPVSGNVRGHFDFVDGISQPKVEASEHKSAYSDQITPGDLLLGYENSFGDPALTGKLWDDSTFMVVRKLKQNVKVLDDVLNGSRAAGVVKAKFMGRTANGEVLIDGKMITGNDFDYSKDPDGKACPFQSHIRRANPRSTRDDIRTVPRIMRRGMSYGPPFNQNPDAERGLFFMAYNASIAEQFEVIQAWLSGSNSSDRNTYSALRDPFLGVPQEGDPHSFVYYDDSGMEHVVPLPPDKPIVKLEWGLYAFIPSIKAIAELKEIAADAARIECLEDKDDPKKKDRRTLELAGYAQKGAAIIAKLGLAEKLQGFEAAAEQWKIVLEDMGPRLSGASQAVWAAIRELHGGVLRTPHGVLVCSKKRVDEVFNNCQRRYTVTGYAERMRASFGEIYLGKDDDRLPTSKYRAEACPANKAIMNVTRKDAFDSALKHTRNTLRLLVAGSTERKLEVRDIVDSVLADLSAEWFGVPDGKHVVGGGWHWRPDDHPTCPGHFHSPSRYMFQPNPGPEAARIGEQHGRATNTAVRRLLDALGNNGKRSLGKIGNALFDAFSGDKELLTSTLIGVMMGFLPTVDGNIRGVLYEWVNSRSLWDHQLDYLGDEAGDSLEKACRILMPPLRKTLLLRPVPELAWRTALVQHSLGQVEVNPGDRIVVSIVSATQECLMNDKVDGDGLYTIFGGNRSKENHPTHACPGYEMAIGVMLGMLAGLLGSTRLRPTMSPVQLAVSMR
ncbi:Dyp-type peroxidase domain-containing protein [Bradyrhizobium sp. 170]|uniref:Dyp-type peroxidase domain-containing protein n=1 Tax=Bradyrhizobium sp. 170 TaxID=2782641 RepID=UPI00200017BF|nr:Dyp-type peroxidase domain-containing protein [Bradyrhizobium sp. 170]UPK04510.1 Dyp-type peroxidase [Bradyrhizobium sp. 170]